MAIKITLLSKSNYLNIISFIIYAFTFIYNLSFYLSPIQNCKICSFTCLYSPQDPDKKDLINTKFRNAFLPHANECSVCNNISCSHSFEVSYLSGQPGKTVELNQGTNSSGLHRRLKKLWII